MTTRQHRRRRRRRRCVASAVGGGRRHRRHSLSSSRYLTQINGNGWRRRTRMAISMWLVCVSVRYLCDGGTNILDIATATAIGNSRRPSWFIASCIAASSIYCTSNPPPTDQYITATTHHFSLMSTDGQTGEVLFVLTTDRHTRSSIFKFKW